MSDDHERGTPPPGPHSPPPGQPVSGPYPQQPGPPYPNPYLSPGQPPPGPYPPQGYYQYPYPPPVDPRAQRLVNISHVLGWGGLATMFLLAPILGGVAGSMVLGVVLAGLGLASAVAGAIIGQIGRGMQGRVI